MEKDNEMRDERSGRERTTSKRKKQKQNNENSTNLLLR